MTFEQEVRSSIHGIVQEAGSPPNFDDMHLASIDRRGEDPGRGRARVWLALGAIFAVGAIGVSVFAPSDNTEDVATTDTTATDGSMTTLGGPTTETTAPTTTETLAPTTEAVVPTGALTPSSGWSGIVVAEGEAVRYIALPSLEEVASVTVPSDTAASGAACSTDLAVSPAGVSVGVGIGGGATQALIVPWESDIDLVLVAEPTELFANGFVDQQSAGGAVIEVDNSLFEGSGPTLTLTAADGTTTSATYPELQRQRMRLHGFDGQYLIVRAEPDEPACNRGVVFAIDTQAGEVLWCNYQAPVVLSGRPADAAAAAALPSELSASSCGS